MEFQKLLSFERDTVNPRKLSRNFLAGQVAMELLSENTYISKGFVIGDLLPERWE